MKSPLLVPAWISFACIGLALLACGGVGGCLDFTPITKVPRDNMDGGDAGFEIDGAPDAQAQTPCLSCAMETDDAGGCASELAHCNTLPECKATVRCVVGQCFEPGVDITQCLGACEADGGVASSTGAPNTAFAAFLQCMSVHCVSVCLQ
jgi:hypothetical protein